eukprot:CAMPEP_0113615754 /NCGR_PEP_ID=MMETSP0017_2-20120614/7873_1 /TAXON_ID=2856 /ORGANISM="Cylindrotheca closterium" /LENGTH=223 /DNA_ID=CAMNT_0000525019 /DNA_START=757 /DNA_END=1428 /DNA_ORIENTATION=+ /assembly_acc=CAM_ASM_000147
MAKRLKESWSATDRTNPDIERNLQVIRAMLSLNTEIWERCKLHMEPFTVSEKWATFQRQQFKVVRAGSHFAGELSFSALYETEKKTFNIAPLCICPTNLAIFQFEYLPYPNNPRFIDYAALLERALLLHDDVLEPFLVELKKHIEGIQVVLGTIEEWLHERLTVSDFIESSFGVDLTHTFGGSGERKLRTCFVSGSHVAEFQVVKESERMRLTKFLDFISAAP